MYQSTVGTIAKGKDEVKRNDKTAVMSDTKSRLHILWNRMKKKKTVSAHDHDTELRRCLSTVHLTFMGVGCTVGVGIYILVGVAAKEYAGPGVILSFIMAGIVTLMNALCFAEFGARIPKTGAIYTYVYESTCEILAFLSGWIMLAGFLSSGAIAARAWSGYLDSLFDNYIHDTITQYIGKVTLGPPFSPTLDFLACAYEIVVIIIISVGVHASAFISSILAGVSVAVLLFVTIMGFCVGDIDNFVNSEHGGFLPFGISGVLAGTAACFYALQGFDVICMSAEECKTPGKSVPRAILLELLIVTLLYVGSSCGLILLIPYTEINTRAPLPSAFAYLNIQWAKYVVSIGPTLGISNLNILNLYNISRHVYCMSSDGLLFKTFLVVNDKTKVPVRATVAMGLIVAVFALLLDMTNLVSFSVIAGFLTSVLSAAILILSRKTNFRKDTPVPDEISEPLQNGTTSTDENVPFSNSRQVQTEPSSFIGQIAHRTGLITLLCLVILTSFGLGLQLIRGIDDLQNGETLAIVCVCLLTCILIVLSVLISTLTSAAAHEGFSMPLVPYLPVLTIVVNVVLLIAAGDVIGVVGYIILVLSGLGIYVTLVLLPTTSSSDTTPGASVEDKTEEETALMGAHEDDEEDEM